MKKIILSQLKSIQEHCITFSCCLNAGFSSLFWTNKFIKKLFFYATLLLVFSQPSLYSQAVQQGGTVKSNFGVDGDVKARINSQNSDNPDLAPVSDDWFSNTGVTGTGKGVIRESDDGTTTNDNLIFDPGSNPNPYGVVRMVNGIFAQQIDGSIWIDGGYIKDQQTAGNLTDYNVFGSTSDKNSDNPASWTVKTGTVPQKDDIIDVYGHLRRNPPGPAGDRHEWVFLGLSVRASSGTKYADFELFRNGIKYDNGVITIPDESASTGGRRPWTFSAAGKITQFGDVIISFDYSQGGTAINGRSYVWMDLKNIPNSVLDAVNNAPASLDSPFEFIKVKGNYVRYVDGKDAGTYGYIEIKAKNSVQAFYGVVNNVQVDGPQWGTIGDNGKSTLKYDPLRFAEFGVDLTVLGFDTNQSGTDCSSKPFGTVVVKTRSSDSFVAELKDFAGPFELGAAPGLAVALEATNAPCYGGTGTITATITGQYAASELEIKLDDGDWETLTSLTKTFTGLGVGAETHSVYVRPAGSTVCSVSKSIEVTQPDALDLVLTPTNAKCYGDAMSISVAVTGTPLSDIEIQIDAAGWNTVTASPVVFNSLTAGEHTVVIRRISENICLVSKKATVSTPDALDLVLTPTNAKCYGDAMSISAAVTGTPLSDIEIQIDAAGWNTVTASPVVFNSLTAGEHTVVIRRISENTCLVSKKATVSTPDALDLVLTPTNGTCINGAMSISAAVTGTPLSDIEIQIDAAGWNTVTASPVVFNSLTAGEHTVVIRRISETSCLVSKKATVSGPANCAHLFPTQTTCCNYLGGTKENFVLENVCITLGTSKANKPIISNAIPGVFFYYGDYYAVTGGTTTIIVDQTTTNGLAIFDPQNSSNVRLFVDDCQNVTPSSITIGGQAGKGNVKIEFTAIEGHTYVISVKYEVKSIVGTTPPSPLAGTYASFGMKIKTTGDYGPLVGVGKVDVVEGCSDTSGTPSGPCPVFTVTTTTAKVAPTDATGFDAYPVPFKDQLTIKYKFDYKTDVKIEVFNAQGMSVLSKTDTDSFLDKEVTLDLKASKRQEQVYVVKVTTNQGTFTKKVMSSK